MADGERTGVERRLMSDVQRLAAGIGERHPGVPAALAAAQEHIRGGLAAAGWGVAAEPVAWQGHALANLVAERAGADGSWVLVLAHYDTVPGCPGADDNASGVAALLELARRWAGRPLPGPGLRLVASTNEEVMHRDPAGGGAAVHAAGCQARGERLRAVLALDTLACFDPRPGTQGSPRWWLRPWFGWRGDYLAVAGPWAARALARRLAAAMRGPLPVRALALPAGIAWALAGDHGPFARLGVPAVRLCDTDRLRYPHWHRRDDHPGMIDPAGLAAAVEAADRGLAELLAG